MSVMRHQVGETRKSDRLNVMWHIHAVEGQEDRWHDESRMLVMLLMKHVLRYLPADKVPVDVGLDSNFDAGSHRRS